MILVDTSIWIDHLRSADPRLQELLEQDEACTHGLVLTGLAVGALSRRAEVLVLCSGCGAFRRVRDAEAQWLIESRRLWGQGLSAVDVHLLAAVLAVDGAMLWTRDMRLAAAADDLGVAWR
ncbi:MULTISPECIES: PIN domain-containing protein [unclassified Actinomyces]|uniref:PIN domain-containing protein n=1 Tax=unclassified Actinomyces TaxID=2609248 RepID=UPI002017CE0D|nr:MULTISPECIES: PIN domain-containing protein [unclassified Actinomyces]MCL3776873.1 PIN domain-containing protein [Actinomyces sp. AC-20-1]MCL3790384.1 PIN domain-containing protein [Actinomyces sp. 187325]MCL3792810.1 PIN domain-containing protein [Actinomyces sp. 186855]MCL3795272.1 PIN domain-containing protein [Actinomyces sp. 217892]